MILNISIPEFINPDCIEFGEATCIYSQTGEFVGASSIYKQDNALFANVPSVFDRHLSDIQMMNLFELDMNLKSTEDITDNDTEYIVSLTLVPKKFINTKSFPKFL